MSALDTLTLDQIRLFVAVAQEGTAVGYLVVFAVRRRHDLWRCAGCLRHRAGRRRCGRLLGRLQRHHDFAWWWLDAERASAEQCQQEKVEEKGKEKAKAKETKKNTMTIRSNHGPIVVENTMAGFMKVLTDACEREVRRTEREH